MDELLMKDLISAKHKHLLYKDECPELTDFLILNWCEVYRTSKTQLRILSWSPSKCSQLRKMGVISDEWSTDDGLRLGTVDNSKLDVLIQLGAPKQRIHKKGKNLLKLEELLAHKIYPFNPKII